MRYYVYELYRQTVRFDKTEYEYSYWKLCHSKGGEVLRADSEEAAQKQHADATIWLNNPRVYQIRGFNNRVIPPYVFASNMELFESEFS